MLFLCDCQDMEGEMLHCPLHLISWYYLYLLPAHQPFQPRSLLVLAFPQEKHYR